MALAQKPGRLMDDEDLWETRAWVETRTPGLSKNMRRYIAQSIGPQKVGGVYWSGYWRETYTVTEVTLDSSGHWSVTCDWHGDAQCANPRPPRKGQPHHTPWHMTADRIIRQPDEPEPRCGATITFGGSDPSGSECDLEPQHAAEDHEGPDPFGCTDVARVSWKGGGSCAGDSLVVRDVKFFIKEGS